MVNSHGQITCPTNPCCLLLTFPFSVTVGLDFLPRPEGRSGCRLRRVFHGFQEPLMPGRLTCCRPERRARFMKEGRMPILRKLQEFLEQNQVAYTHTVHPLAYTARDVAAAEHVPAHE